MDDQNAINQREWERLENWSWFGTYRSVRDSRLLVPKRTWGWGLTPNFAHRGSRWMVLGLSSVPLGFLLLFVLYQLSK